jgi:thioredoxin
MPLIVVNDDAHYVQEMNNQGVKLVVVDYTASWCGPCQRIAPIFEELSRKYHKATFLKVDVDKCKESAASQGVSAMPTFILYRNKTKLDRIQGADATALEAKIKQYYGTVNAGEGDEDDGGIPGFMSLASFIYKNQCECLNESDDHSLLPFLEHADRYLESDCDPQLIISLAFTQPMKVHSLKIKAPASNGPKNIKLFINLPNTIDFDNATNNTATQELELTPKDLEGNVVNLRFVKFQNVQNLQIFVKDNQGDEETTRIDNLIILGLPIASTNMGEFKRVAGKVGESH